MRNPLCKYANIAGEPGKGIHATRFLGVAIYDVIGTIVGAIIISLIFRWHIFYTILAAFLLGIIAHYIFCVKTALNVKIAEALRVTFDILSIRRI